MTLSLQCLEGLHMMTCIQRMEVWTPAYVLNTQKLKKTKSSKMILIWRIFKSYFRYSFSLYLCLLATPYIFIYLCWLPHICLYISVDYPIYLYISLLTTPYFFIYLCWLPHISLCIYMQFVYFWSLCISLETIQLLYISL